MSVELIQDPKYGVTGDPYQRVIQIVYLVRN